MSIGIYIHIPFCERKCPYCDFYSVCDDRLTAPYCDALLRSITELPDGIKADTVYFGGGTPSLFAKQLEKILEALSKKVILSGDAEITAEINPNSSSKEVFRLLRSAGVNRLSIGVQSFADDELKTLGRLHSADTAEKTFFTAREEGFRNISLDLMLAVWGQTAETLDLSIGKIKELAPEHISAYMLILEEGTEFEDKIPVDEEEQGKQYLHICQSLEAMGLMQYEISNFARAGFECRHNLKYWRDEEYIGLGPAAHSYYKGKRFYYPRDIDSFIKGNSPIFDGDGGSLEEKIMLGLRLCEGVEKALISAPTENLIKAGLIIEKAGRIALTKRGFLLSNAVIAKLLQ